MQAVIVAAGLSRRLRQVTSDPKVLLEVGGESLLRRSIGHLVNVGAEPVYVVVGYQSQQILDHCSTLPVQFISNPFYAHCNNMASLWFAKPFVGDETFLYLHGDLIYDPAILRQNLETFAKRQWDLQLVTEFGSTDEEAMKVKVDSSGHLRGVGKELPLREASGEWIGLTLVSEEGSRKLFEEIEKLLLAGNLQAYDTRAFLEASKKGLRVGCVSTEGHSWVEVDDATGLERARQLFPAR